MKVCLCIVLLLAVQASVTQNLAAQTNHLQAYVVAGPGRLGDDGIVYVAGGAEFIGPHRIGVSGEIGRLSGVRPFLNRTADFTLSTMMGALELIVPVAPSTDTSRVTPFARAGVGFMSNPPRDSALAYLFGGGIDTHMNAHIGVRTDVRIMYGLGKTTWIGRAGIVFR
jgi:hypothetical protein